MPQAKTIKQAKAAYKSRTEQPLTEREQKQLDRSVQLDRRAWALREREKNRLDLSKKRIAQEKAQQDEERRIGTQRRNDKFGFKSSQFHLGAFFRNPAPVAQPGVVVEKAGSAVVVGGAAIREPSEEDQAADFAREYMELEGEDEDEFEDVDDETLLEALQSPEVVRSRKAQLDGQANPGVNMPPPPRPAPVPSTPNHIQQAQEPLDTDLDWNDFLESSSQVARDIGADGLVTPCPPARTPTAKETPRKGSFSSGSFDLTEDDIEQLDPTPRASCRGDHHAERGNAKAAAERRKMPPRPLQRMRVSCGSGAGSNCHDVTANSVQAREELGFTMTQLESFVEDDLELSQTG